MLGFDSWPPEPGKVHLQDDLFAGPYTDSKEAQEADACAKGLAISTIIGENTNNREHRESIIRELSAEALLLTTEYKADQKRRLRQDKRRAALFLKPFLEGMQAYDLPRVYIHDGQGTHDLTWSEYKKRLRGNGNIDPEV